MTESKSHKANIAILGGGFAGLSAARVFGDEHSVTLVDKDSYFEWTPNIHELLSDVKTVDNLTLDYQNLLSGEGHRFLRDHVVKVNPNTNTVHYQSGLCETYDAIILSIGHKVEHYKIDGAKQHTLPFKKLDDAIALKQKIDATLSANSATGNETTITVAGGGFTGIEILGELHRAYHSRQRINFQLIEKQPSFLSKKHQEVSDSIIELCATNGIDLFLGSAIKSFSEGQIHLNHDKDLKSDITVWAAGTSASTLSDSDAFIKSSAGVATNGFLQAMQQNGQILDRIFIAGDYADTNGNQAKQAYHALSMGELAAKNCILSLKEKPLEKFRPQTEISLLSFGHLNTYALTPYGSASSPLLAAAKESVFQLQMANLCRGLPINDQVSSIIQRHLGSVTKLALPQLRLLTPKSVFAKSKLFF